MASGGTGGGGGGGGSAPKVTVPGDVGVDVGSGTDNLARFSAGTFPGILSLINWAGDIATGGNFNQSFSPYNQWGYSSALGTSPGPGIDKSGTKFGGAAFNTTQFPGFGSSGTGSTAGSGGVAGNEATSVTGTPSAWGGGGTWAQPATQMVNFQDSNQQTLSILGSPVNFNGASYQPIYDANSQKFIGWMTPNGSAVNASSTQGLAPMMYTPPGGVSTGGAGGGGGGAGGTSGGGTWQSITLSNGTTLSADQVARYAGATPDEQAAVAKGLGVSPDEIQSALGQQQQQQLLGPFLSTAWNAVGQMSGLMGETGSFTKNAETSATNLAAESDRLMQQAQPLLAGKLTPDQQAYVDQATKSEQAAVASQLGAEGLASSTAAPILAGEVAQQGAATAGQLEQGNIQLGQTQEQIAQQEMNLSQAASKLALGGIELSLGEQTALEQEAQGLQQQMWTQAMQGYGVLAQMIQTSLSAFDLSFKGLSQYTQASIADSEAAAAIEKANIEASSSSGSSAGGGLGSLFGMLGGGGGGGGLFGGIGSLLGGGGAAAGVLGSAGGASLGAGEAATAAIGAAGGLLAF